MIYIIKSMSDWIGNDINNLLQVNPIDFIEIKIILQAIKLSHPLSTPRLNSK
jgi:hypothetical protein